VPEDCVYPYVEKYASQGTILDLGCGPGSTGSEINTATYSAYTGVDISEVAIAKAKTRTEKDRRTNKNEYIQSEIVTYVPTHAYDVILFGDSLYYFPHRKTAEILDRYSKYLKLGGVFIVRIYDPRGKHRAIVRTIEDNFDVVEKHLYRQSQILVIAFRPGPTLDSAKNRAG